MSRLKALVPTIAQIMRGKGRRPVSQTADTDRALSAESGTGAGQRNALHPFFAFSRIPGSKLIDALSEERLHRLCAPASIETGAASFDVRANNVGFFSPVDYPCNRQADADDPFIIGVFGGSAAQLFAVQGGSDLCDELGGTEVVQGRRPIALNCASGGMKQPQTILALTYLLTEGQRFDAVVLIDGFNEAALSYCNWEAGYSPTAPSMQHMEQLTNALDQFKAAGENPSAGRDEIAGQIARHWAESSRLVHDLCRSQSIPIVHLVQPNQYHSSKTLSTDERAHAVSETTPYRRAVEATYPSVAQAAHELARAGYNVVNAMSAFDEIEETIYSDNCCHYNLRGALVLKDIVLDGLLMAKPTTKSAAAPPLPSVAAVHARADDSDPTGPGRMSTKRDTAVEDDALYPMW